MCEQKCKFKTCWTLSHLLADAVRYSQHEIFIFSFGQAKIYTTLSWARKIVAHCMRMERDDVRREMFRKTFIQYYIPGGWANAGDISSYASSKKVEWNENSTEFSTAVVGDLWLSLLFLGKISTLVDLPLFSLQISRTHETSLDVAEELSVLVQLAFKNSRPNSTDVVISFFLLLYVNFHSIFLEIIVSALSVCGVHMIPTDKLWDGAVNENEFVLKYNFDACSVKFLMQLVSVGVWGLCWLLCFLLIVDLTRPHSSDFSPSCTSLSISHSVECSEMFIINVSNCSINMATHTAHQPNWWE